MAIQSSSAVLKAFFQTGDVPTETQFGDLIDSFALYDGTLPLISGSGTSVGAFNKVVTNIISASSPITLASSLIPDYNIRHSVGSEAYKLHKIHASSASFDYVSSSLTPLTTKTYTLGTMANAWSGLHVHGIGHIHSASINVVSSSLIPDKDNHWSLGSSDYEWKNLHLDGTAYIDTISNQAIISASHLATTAVNVITASIGKVSSSLIPDGDDLYDLGASGQEWKDLYIDGTAYIDTINISALDDGIEITGISSSIQVSGSIIPEDDNAWDLGSSTQEWKNLYIDGTANIDTLAGVTSATIPGSASIDVLSVNSNVSSSLIPGKDDTWDLGSSTLQWKDLYIDGTGNIDTLNTDNITATTASISYLSGSSNIIVASTMEPSSDNTWDLGSLTSEWKDVYINGKLHVDELANYGLEAISSSASLYPSANNAFDLGKSSLQWKNLYIKGTATLDTTDISTGSIGQLTSNLLPSANNAQDLGASNSAYRNLHVSGTAYLQNATVGGFVGGNTVGNKQNIDADTTVTDGFNAILYYSNYNSVWTIDSGYNYTINSKAHVRLVNMDNLY